MKLSACLLAAAFLLAAACARAQTMPPPMADLAARVLPAVVSIASTDPVTGNTDDDGDDNGDGGDNGDGSAYHPTADATSGSVIAPPKAIEALGSGFVFDPAGYILTNAHVINGATSVTVTFQDGTILPASIIGRDTKADIAVLKVDAGHSLPTVKFGDSSKMRVGDWVLAIGNPFGLPGSSSAGIVSALNRDISAGPFDDYIQTDATINRGNSGGPLFNMAGEVIGVDAAIYSPSGGSIGLGFAIPSAMAEPVAASIKATGGMTRGWLGAATEEVTPDEAAMLGLPGTSGALIGAVAANGSTAGVLAPGDVITGLDGVAITNPRALLVRTAEIPAGTQVSVKFWRDGVRRQTSFRLNAPPPAVDDTLAQAQAAAPKNIDFAALGLAVSAKLVPGGVNVIAATGPAASAGIVAGDLIEQVAGQNVTTAAALRTQVQALRTDALPVAVFLVSGDDSGGNDPGPRWVAVAFKK